jgi:hypothetical protein
LRGFEDGRVDTEGVGRTNAALNPYACNRGYPFRVYNLHLHLLLLLLLLTEFKAFLLKADGHQILKTSCLPIYMEKFVFLILKN